MKTKITTTAILFLANFVQLWACSCEALSDNFCGTITAESKVIAGVVVDTPEDYLRTFEIINTIQGITPDESIITILGQDGLNCGENVHQFAVGDTVIMALYDHDALYAEPYLLYGCDRSYLRIQNGKVVGPIHGTETEEEEYDYFVSNLNECNLEVDVIEKPIGELININPTLIEDNFQIQNLSNESIDLILYDSQGRISKSMKLSPASNTLLDISHQSPGLFFAAIRREKNFSVKKLVKL